MMQYADTRNQEKEFVERVIQVNRVSKKTKGGNQMGFSVLVVVGDQKGRVGAALGKAKDVSSAVQKGIKRAKRVLVRVPINGTTLPFSMIARFGASHILLKPAPPGSGIIAGGSVRIVLDAAGVRDVSCKILGTNNPVTNVYATIKGLRDMYAVTLNKHIKLKTIEQLEQQEKTELRQQTTEKEVKKEELKQEAAKAEVVVEKPEKKVVKKIVKKAVKKTDKKKEA